METDRDLYQLDLENMGIEAVAFDYGGVIADMISVEDLLFLSSLAGVSPDAFRRSYWTHRAHYDSGHWDFEQYLHNVLEDCSSPLAELADYGELLILDTLAYSRIRLQMIDWITKLRSRGFHLVLVSNMGSEEADELIYTTLWAPQFHDIVISGEIGINKPSPGFYTHFLSLLPCKAEKVLFIDDREENIRAACAAGCRGAHLIEPGRVNLF